MWDYIINIHPSELLNKKTKEFIINESYIYIYIYKIIGKLFILKEFYFLIVESNVEPHHKYSFK